LDRLSRSSKMRAQAEGGSGDEAELEFVYLGPTEEVAPLASGRVRRQLGLKLRAKDSCNVLYVMWRIEPGPDLVVSLKSNPGKTRHAECGSAGYRTIRPRHRGQVPRLQVGARHVMRARLEGNALRAWIDGDLAWEGEVSGLDFDGPVGVRSDNVRFAFSLRTPAPSPPRGPPSPRRVRSRDGSGSDLRLLDRLDPLGRGLGARELDGANAAVVERALASVFQVELPSVARTDQVAPLFHPGVHEIRALVWAVAVGQEAARPDLDAHTLLPRLRLEEVVAEGGQVLGLDRQETVQDGVVDVGPTAEGEAQGEEEFVPGHLAVDQRE